MFPSKYNNILKVVITRLHSFSSSSRRSSTYEADTWGASCDSHDLFEEVLIADGPTIMSILEAFTEGS